MKGHRPLAGGLALHLGAAVVALGLLALGASPLQAQEAVYRVRGSQLPVASMSNGHLQTLSAGADGVTVVHVATSWDPIGAVGTHASVLATGPQRVPEGFGLPRHLTHRVRPQDSAFEAATAVLDWVASRVRLDPEDLAPQDAWSVLSRRRGRCSGLANITAALLLAAGFEARTVSGLLVDGVDAVPHRWVECRLPVAGWVPTDPTLGLWVVTPRHLVFADAVTDPPEVETVTLHDGRLDLLPQHHGRRLRPNVGSELVCRVVGGTPVRWPTAVLTGPGGETRRSLLQPEGRFSRLLPGLWHLTVELDGRVLARRQVELRLGALNTINLNLGAGDGVGS
jgi:hypothetical protein